MAIRVPEKLYKLVETAVEALGYELVGVEQAGSVLRVYIDALGGITIDDCERVSHQISGALDVEDLIAGPYTLEVSSPGLDRPLFTPEHFARFTGRIIKFTSVVPIEGRRRFKGLLEAVRDDEITVNVDGHTLVLKVNDIETARLVPDLPQKHGKPSLRN
jgi:ribosome maturation factor RimP